MVRYKKRQDVSEKKAVELDVSELKKQKPSRPYRKRDAVLNIRIFSSSMDALTAFSAMQRMSKTAVVEAALAEFFENNLEAPHDRRNYYLYKRIDEIADVANLQAEAFFTFMQYWFAHTPQIPEELKKDANIIAKDRFSVFLDFLQDNMIAGRLVTKKFTEQSQDEEAPEE